MGLRDLEDTEKREFKKEVMRAVIAHREYGVDDKDMEKALEEISGNVHKITSVRQANSIE